MCLQKKLKQIFEKKIMHRKPFEMESRKKYLENASVHQVFY